MPGGRRYLRRIVALPPEHGAWAFLLAPLVIGIAAGGRYRITSTYLIVAALCAFLVRQPITVGLKILTGVRPRELWPAVRLWTGIYAGVGLLHVVGLVLRGFGYVLWLAVPGIPVFVWHLMLIRRREQRRQWLVELVGAGVLALIAPAGYWIGVGRPDPAGWWLWALAWLQSVSWIFTAYLRLTRREGRRGWELPALAASAAPLLLAVGLAVAGLASPWLWCAFGVQTTESLLAVFFSSPGAKPRSIGYRQLVVSVIQTVLFVLLW